MFKPGRRIFYLLFIFIVGLFFYIFCKNASFFKPLGSWVRTEKGNFVKEGAVFKFIGASAVNLVFYDNWGLDVDKAIRTARDNNISVLRIYIDWGWGQDEDYDRVLAAASKYGVYVILSLTDCCCSSDYLSLEKYYSVRAPFCNISNEISRNAFKNRIRQILERKNSVNGRVYRDDPTILAWEIANELEYWHFTQKEVLQWVSEIACYIKKYDKNHLLTVGIGVHNAELKEWSEILQMFDAPEIDFFSFHFNPNTATPEAYSSIQENHRIIKVIIKSLMNSAKPVVMGEFGFSNSGEFNSKMRSEEKTVDAYCSTLKEYMNFAFDSGCAAVMFWGWGVPEEKKVPMWWNEESHSIQDKKFCMMLKEYKF